MNKNAYDLVTHIFHGCVIDTGCMLMIVPSSNKVITKHMDKFDCKITQGLDKIEWQNLCMDK